MGLYSLFIEKILLPAGDALFGGNYLKTMKTWEQYDTFSEQSLLKIQDDALEQILKYSIKHVPFYKNQVYDSQKSPQQNLQHFPVLTKDILRGHSADLVSNEFNTADLKKNFSSGSSGVQSFSYSEKKNSFYLQGISSHWYRWGGYRFGQPTLQFGISPKRTLPKKLKDFFYKVNYQNAFVLSDADYAQIYLDLKKDKTRHIIGYPSAINQFAEYLIKNKLSFGIESIISLGDKLFPHYETHFNTAFANPKIIDTYGCAEGFLIACKYDLPYYYISAPHLYVEIVDEHNSRVPDGTLGHVLITCFSNVAQPFLRYKLGDLGIMLPKEKYPENRAFEYPLLEKIVGRETDIVKTPNGKTLIVHSFTGIIEYFPDILQYRIIQDTIAAIVIEYRTDARIPLQEDTLEKIEEEINLLTDSSLKIIFKKVDSIPATPSGKPQIIKSNLIVK